MSSGSWTAKPRKACLSTRRPARAPGGVSRASEAQHAMDLGRGLWPGGSGHLRLVHGIHRALGTTVRTSRLRKHESAESGGISGRILERMAIHVQFVRGACGDDLGRLRLVRISPLFAARLGAGGAVYRIW